MLKILLGMMVVMVVGCGGGERVVERRVVEVREVEYVKKPVVEVEKLLEKVAGLATDNGKHIDTYCAGVWVGEHEILTAHHCMRVVSEEVKVGMKVRVVGYDDMVIRRSYGARLVRDRAEHDLSLLRVEEEVRHSIAKVAKERVRLGGGLHIVGHAQGLNWSYIEGWVSAYRNFRVKHGEGPFMQITAPIYYGDSGGGSFNEAGELVGITSFIDKTPNVGFAIDLEHIKEILNGVN